MSELSTTEEKNYKLLGIIPALQMIKNTILILQIEIMMRADFQNHGHLYSV